MAGGGGDILPVDCGVLPKGGGFVLSYRVGKNVDKKDVSWQWCEFGDEFVAMMKAKTKTGDMKYHNSALIGANMRSKLQESKGKMDGVFYTIRLKKNGEVPDLTTFFNVPQEGPEKPGSK